MPFVTLRQEVAAVTWIGLCKQYFSVTKDCTVKACFVLISEHMFNFTCGKRSVCFKK